MDIGYEGDATLGQRQRMIEDDMRAQAYAAKQQSVGGMPSPEKSVQEIERRLHRDIGGVNEAIMRIRNIADELFGARPEPCEDSAENSLPVGRISEITDLQSRLQESVGELHSQISRLERLA